MSIHYHSLKYIAMSVAGLSRVNYTIAAGVISILNGALLAGKSATARQVAFISANCVSPTLLFSTNHAQNYHKRSKLPFVRTTLFTLWKSLVVTR